MIVDYTFSKFILLDVLTMRRGGHGCILKARDNAVDPVRSIIVV